MAHLPMPRAPTFAEAELKGITDKGGRRAASAAKTRLTRRSYKANLAGQVVLVVSFNPRDGSSVTMPPRLVRVANRTPALQLNEKLTEWVKVMEKELRALQQEEKKRKAESHGQQPAKKRARREQQSEGQRQSEQGQGQAEQGGAGAGPSGAPPPSPPARSLPAGSFRQMKRKIPETLEQLRAALEDPINPASWTRVEIKAIFLSVVGRPVKDATRDVLLTALLDATKLAVSSRVEVNEKPRTRRGKVGVARAVVQGCN